ncbi:hypothetical protein D3C85_1817210 [compost metagenome]
MLLNEGINLFRQALEEGWILIMMDSAMLTDGMLHLTGLGLTVFTSMGIEFLQEVLG